MTRKRMTIWILIAAAAGAATVVLVFGLRHWRPRWSAIQGAVVRRDTDTRMQSPIPDAVVTATHGDVTVSTKSDATGYFKVTFPGTVLPGTPVSLTFRHPDYNALDLEVPIQFRSSLRQLVVAAMMPVAA